VLDDLWATEVAKGPTHTDWAYAAGFVDGEGCIAVTRSFLPARGFYGYGVAVVVSNRDRHVLEWFREVWSGHVVSVQTSGRGLAQDAWNWRSPSGQSAQFFLEGIRPWLRIKTKQCDNALAMIRLLRRSRRRLGPNPMPAEWRAEQEGLYWIQRELNHRGSAAFVKVPMHSPRKIRRERAMVANQGL
jgi:hypothetical protein